MLRIVFSEEDLTRVSFRLSSQFETIGSLAALRHAQPRSAVQAWRRRAVSTFPRRALPLLDLMARTDCFPGFLVPSIEVAPTSDELRQQMQQVAKNRTDLGSIREYGRTAMIRGIVRGEQQAFAELGCAVREYFRYCLAPVSRAVEAVLRDELHRRGTQLVADGLGAALGSLSPQVRWHGRDLLIDSPCELDVELGGRGLTLVPSVFWPSPIFSLDAYRTPTLVYPVALDRGLTAMPPEADALGSLLGRTRAAVAQALRDGGSTGEIAARTGVSAASASEHVAALRRAGLVSTIRTGRSVLHTLTPVGRQVVRLLDDPTPYPTDLGSIGQPA